MVYDLLMEKAHLVKHLIPVRKLYYIIDIMCTVLIFCDHHAHYSHSTIKM